MFEKLGRWSAAHRRWVVVGTVLFILLGGLWGSGAGNLLGGGAGLDDPTSESSHADEILETTLGRHVADVVVMYESAEMTVDDPRFRARVEDAVAKVPRSSYTWLETFWTTGSADFVSADRHKTYISMQLPGQIEEDRVVVWREIEHLFDQPGLEVRFGGLVAVNDQFNDITEEDLARAELISFPLLLILLIVIFRSAIAAALPLAVGIVVSVGSLAVLRVVGNFTDLSTFSINLVVLLGLGLAIDYALLIVNRFRDELAAGRTVDDAIGTTMATAGRTVAVSGITVAVTLGGLVIFPSRFLTSLGYSGVSVVLFAVLGALIVMPALLRFAGLRINSLRIPLPSFGKRGGEQGARWYKVAHAVMRRPVLAAGSIGLVLVLLGLPLLGATWSRPADWALPAGTDSRVVSEELDRDFPLDPTKVITAVVDMPGDAASPQAQQALSGYLDRLRAVQGVDSAAVTGTAGDLARVTLGYSMDSMDAPIRDVVRQLRAVEPPAESTASFTNRPAAVADLLDMLAERLPWMLLIVTVVSFAVLFLAFGSVLLPLKSVLMNLLSLFATFGIVALIFQYGFLSGPLNFVPAGFMDANMPMMIMAIAFGLAMDYEVFLLARIREHYLRSGDPVESVAFGVRHTARLITSAALLLAVVLGAFVFSGITIVKMIGVGLVLAIFLDATIVRGLLVPATMRLLGDKAWWAPKPLATWWQKYGIPEPGADVAPEPGGAGRPSGIEPADALGTTAATSTALSR
ncbi:MMPL family transporter [Nocardia amikacinitolerans]|uniref:MMPL family transporter n=1 Tax=Nocardia amikacinitolerans TaxID=756689 RepID=UPI00368E8182